MKKTFYFFLLCFLGWTGLMAQEDSLQIPLDQLTWEDILANPQLQISKKVSGASRSLKDIQDLPFSIYVIEGEEIRNNGYLTLMDALKMLPGIKVSQPGSALEGETFMMRGLLGNAYAKILINGIPIKPYMVSGMPIGVQLPIQQAARIEVIYGPTAALYGADATTGVINIVMEESERPIFTNTSLHIGSQGYTSIHSLFGGKVGKGNKVLKFRLFGTDTRRTTQRIFYDDDLYNIENYAANNPDRIQDVINTPNYRSTTTTPVLGEIPHVSHSFGINLSYQNFQFSYQDLFRHDHSALGLNPVAISYAIPINSVGESIKEGSIIYTKEFKNLTAQTCLNFLKYNMDNTTSSTYISPTIDNVFNILTLNSLDMVDRFSADSLRRIINDNFFSGVRFANAKSIEYSLEQTLNFTFGKAEINSGLRIQRGEGEPFVDFQPIPIENRTIIENITQTTGDQDYHEFNAFAQLFLPLKKWNILLGAAYLYRNNNEFSEQISSINPRIAFLYKAKQNLSFRASYSTAFKIPSPYFRAATYTVQEDNYTTILTGINPLNSERTFSYELGWRWFVSPKIEWDLAAYYTKTTDFLVYDILRNPNITTRNITAGYFNDEVTSARLSGIQSMLWLKELIPTIGLDARISLNVSKGKELLFALETAPDPDTTGRMQLEEIDGLRAYPNLIAQAQITFKPIKSFTFTLDNVLTSGAITRNVLSIEQALNRGEEEESIRNPGYYTLDVTGNFQLNQNFMIYARFNNVFNKQYAGIDANESPDVLLYNPQPLFNFRFGVNYNLN